MHRQQVTERHLSVETEQAKEEEKEEGYKWKELQVFLFLTQNIKKYVQCWLLVGSLQGTLLYEQHKPIVKYWTHLLGEWIKLFLEKRCLDTWGVTQGAKCLYFQGWVYFTH